MESILKLPDKIKKNIELYKSDKEIAGRLKYLKEILKKKEKNHYTKTDEYIGAQLRDYGTPPDITILDTEHKEEITYSKKNWAKMLFVEVKKYRIEENKILINWILQEIQLLEEKLKTPQKITGKYDEAKDAEGKYIPKSMRYSSEVVDIIEYMDAEQKEMFKKKVFE